MGDEQPKGERPDFDGDVARNSTEKHTHVNIARTIEQAKEKAALLALAGVPVAIVKLQDLVGWAGVPNFMTTEEVSEQIRRDLCARKGIDYKSELFSITHIASSGDHGSSR